MRNTAESFLDASLISLMFDIERGLKYTYLPHLSVGDEIYIQICLNKRLWGFDFPVFLPAKVTWSSDRKHKHEVTIDDYIFGTFDAALDCNHLHGYDDTKYTISIYGGIIYSLIFKPNGICFINKENCFDRINLIDEYSNLIMERIDMFVPRNGKYPLIIRSNI